MRYTGLKELTRKTKFTSSFLNVATRKNALARCGWPLCPQSLLPWGADVAGSQAEVTATALPAGARPAQASAGKHSPASSRHRAPAAPERVQLLDSGQAWLTPAIALCTPGGLTDGCWVSSRPAQQVPAELGTEMPPTLSVRAQRWKDIFLMSSP